MISKLVRKMVEERFGRPVRYSKDCETLAAQISEVCGTTLSSSTLRRLFGFVKGNMQEPRLYTLDTIAAYLGFETWEKLLASFEKGVEAPTTMIVKLKPELIKKGESVQIAYEPGRTIEISKRGAYFNVVASNDKRILVNDEIKFIVMELHHPLTFTDVQRKGNSIGKMQIATVSGITSLKKM